MFERIEKMRNKSFGERKRATFFISVGLTAVIAFVWGTAVLPKTLTLDEAGSSRADTVTPFKTLFEDVELIFGDIKTGVSELGEGFSSLTDGEEPLDPGSEAAADPEMPTMSPRGDVGPVVDSPDISTQTTETVDSEETSTVEVESVSSDTRTIQLESGTTLEIEG